MSVKMSTYRQDKLPFSCKKKLESRKRHLSEHNAEASLAPPSKRRLPRHDMQVLNDRENLSTLVGREEEIARIMSFLRVHVKDHSPGSLYVSGPPGTGKTATLTWLLRQDGQDLLRKYQVVEVNCMTLTKASSVYARVMEELKAPVEHCKFANAEQRLMKYVAGGRAIVLVLDEVDQLSQEVLYSLFALPSVTGSRVLLIGVANSLDLIDRLLPRLQSSRHTRPWLLHFKPNHREDIVAILQSKVPQHVSVDPMALQLCARKIVTQAGDLRKANDFLARASALSGSHIQITHMARALSAGASSMAERPPLPLHQQLVAITLLMLCRESSKKAFSLSKLYSSYVKTCQERKLRTESQCEFVTIVGLVEARGLIRTVKKSKDIMASKVSLVVTESEIKILLRHALSLISSNEI